MYADFRSRGHRVEIEPPVNKEDNSAQDEKNQVETIDCLDVISRQNLAVLFYSKC